MNHLATALILISTFIAPIAAGRGTLPGTVIVCLLAGAGFVLAIKDAWKNKQPVPLWGVIISLLGFLILAIISTAAAESVGAGLTQMPSFLTWGFVFAGALIILYQKQTQVMVLLTLTASGAVMGVIGVREYTTYSPGGDWRVFGTFINPGFFGGYLTIVIPLTLALYIATKHRMLAVAAGGALVLEVASLLLTGTRWAIATTLGSLIVFFIPAICFKAIDLKQWLRLILLAILLIPVAIGASKPLQTRVVDGASQAHSGSFRIVTWKATARMAAANPMLGTGPGTFEIAFPRYAFAGFTREAHQGYLQAASECGIPAAALLTLTLLTCFFGPVFSALRRKNGPISPSTVSQSPVDKLIADGSQRLITYAAIGSTAGFLARNLIDSDIYITGVAVPFWAAAALALSLSGTPGRKLQIKTAAFAAVTGFTGLIAVALLLFTNADVQMNKAIASLEQGELMNAEHSIDNAIKLNPWKAEYQLKRSWILAADPDRFDEAASAVKKAISLEPTRSKYHYSLGRILEADSKPKQALTAYQKAYKIDNHSPTVLLAIADTHRKLGNNSQALEMYRQLAELENTPYATLTGVPELVEPAYAFAHFALGNYSLEDNPEDAIREYNKVIERLNKRDKYAKYVAAMAAAANADPDNERTILDLRMTTYSQMAEAYAKLGQKDKEEKYLELAEKAREKMEEQGW